MDKTAIENIAEKDLFSSEGREVEPYKISHLVSANKLRAYIRIELFDKSAEISSEEILNYLKENNIVYGIREKEIIEYCENKEYSKELIAAQGIAPIHGEDAYIVYSFDFTRGKKFLENEDGTIDFKNLNNVINVKKDTVLAYIVPAKEGKDGVDVFGNPISYRKGKDVYFDYGKNTYISPDGLQLLASTDGAVEYKNGKLFVENVYRVKNVDNTTGNIDFIGSVVIDGDVKEGFSVTALGDIKIRGMVEGAYIKSEGSVVIGRGMNGMSKGTIYAKGDITSKYIENATIETESNVYAEALINSNVKAGDSVIIKGSTAAIIGGTTEAENLIYATTVGNKTNPETNLVLTLKEYYEIEKLMGEKKKKRIDLERELADKNKELKELELKIDLLMNSSIAIQDKTAFQKKLLFMKIKLNSEIVELKRELEEIVPAQDIANYKIICKGKMYGNTRITIGWLKHRVRQDINYSKIYNDGKDIVIVPLNPGDLDL